MYKYFVLFSSLGLFFGGGGEGLGEKGKTYDDGGKGEEDLGCFFEFGDSEGAGGGGG